MAGQRRLDDLLNDRLPQIGDGDLRGMLRRDDDGIEPLDCAGLVIFHGDLALAVGPQPGEAAALAGRCQRPGEHMGIFDGRGHQRLRLVASKAEHHALVPGAGRRSVVKGAVDAHGDIAGLLVDGCQYGAGLAVEARLRGVIADAADCLPGDLGDIHIAGRGNLAHDQDHPRCRSTLAGDAGVGILGQDGVEHTVGDLVAYFIGMPFCHRFGRKNSLFH